VDEQLYPIFQTESLNTVHYILNLDVGVNLASIDNKLYLIQCAEEVTTTTTTPIATTTTTTVPPVVHIVSPSGGEIFAIGDTVTLQWISDKNITDAVKIELYEASVLNQIINPSTSNTGSYDWLVPTGLLPGSHYTIKITWLSSQNPSSATSSAFTILTETPATTTTTTTTTINQSIPSSTNCRGIPILELPDYEYITCMIKDVDNGGILFSTSQGRILGCREAVVNAYLTGERDVFAEVTDGFGNISESAKSSFIYALYNKIAEINEGKEIEKWKYVVKPTAILTDRITGVFLSPILAVKQDLVTWKQLIWRETKPEDTEIIICIRSANTVDELKSLPWDYCFISRDSDTGYGSTGYIIRNLNDYQINGKYLQFKVTMTTDVDTSPSMIDLALSYSTKFAVYFFTTKFSLENNSNMKVGLITGTITEPINTEIQFGISSTNTGDWNEYQVVEVNKFFSLSNLERIKVGIKMIAYDDNIPEVAEFALLSGGDIDNRVNNV